MLAAWRNPRFPDGDAVRVPLTEGASGDAESIMYRSREEGISWPEFKSEWLGAEARVHLPPRALAGNQFMFWRWLLSVRILLLSFSSGLALGSYLALFARGKFGSRHLRIGASDGIEADVMTGERVVALRPAK